MTTFEYALFVSYRHSRQEQNGLLSAFARELTDALERIIDTHLYEDIGRERNSHQVFLDEKVIQGGNWISKDISEGLHRSVCWAFLFTRNYLGGSLYCASELKGMVDLQQKRRRLIGGDINSSLIIPVLLRGNVTDMPPALQGIAVKADFSRFTLAVKNIAEHPDFVTKIEELAEWIAQRQKEQCDKSKALGVNLSEGYQNFSIEDVNTEAGKNNVAQFIKSLNSPEFPVI